MNACSKSSPELVTRGRALRPGHRASPRAAGWLAGVAVVGTLAWAPPALAARFDTTLASVDPFGAIGDDDSLDASISADGRYVAFTSSAQNLGPVVTAPQNVYRRDLQTGATVLVSRATGVAGLPGNNVSYTPSISADGRYVAFSSYASNLGPDANLTIDVFVRDLETHTTTLASRTTGSTGGSGNADAFLPSISGDGRSVAFQTSATNLAADANATPDIFVRNLQANTTTLVSRATEPGGAFGNAPSQAPAISSDGRFVAFQSFASTLGPDGNATEDVFVREIATGKTTLVSRGTGVAGAFGNGHSLVPSISADGRFVAFASMASNFGPDANAVSDIFVRDLLGNTTTLLSRAGLAGASGDAGSSVPSISGDGRSVAFQSLATNLSDDGNATQDVLLRDVPTGATAVASRASGAAGVFGNGPSWVPSISADGRHVAFDSFASNLGPDANATRDVFVREPFGAVPRAVQEPVITGLAMVGSELLCDAGTWDGYGRIAVARQWTRDGAPIAGKTGAQYVVSADDVGRRLACVVTASDGLNRSTEAVSAPVSPVFPATFGPVGPAGPQGPVGNVVTAPSALIVVLWPAKATARVGRKVSFSYVATVSGTARLQIRKAGKTVATVTGSAKAGRNTIVWKGKSGASKAGLAAVATRASRVRAAAVKAGTYSAVLTVTSGGGAVASDSAQLKLKR